MQILNNCKDHAKVFDPDVYYLKEVNMKKYPKHIVSISSLKEETHLMFQDNYIYFVSNNKLIGPIDINNMISVLENNNLIKDLEISNIKIS